MDEFIAEIKALRAEMRQLRTEIADVRNALIIESDSKTKHLGEVYRELRRIEERLDPVMLQVFPMTNSLQEEIDTCMKPRPASPPGERTGH